MDIKITADASQATREFDKLKESEEGVGEGAEKAESGLSKLTAFLGGPAKAAVLAAGVAIAGLTAATLKLANRGELVGSVAEGFQALGGSAAVIDEAAEKTLGLVSAFELTQLANKALIAGLPDVNNNFDDIAEAGARLANTLGKDTTATIEQLTQAIATGRKTQLEQLGVMVDTRAEVEKYAAANGLAVKDVDELTKKTILQNAAMREVRKINQEVADVTLSVANVNEVFKNKLQDTIDRVAIAINSNQTLQKVLAGLGEIFLKLVNFIADKVIGAFDTLDRAVKNAQLGFAVVGKVAEQLARGDFESLKVATEEVVKDMLRAQNEAKVLAANMGALGTATGATSEVTADFSVELVKQAKAATDSAKAIGGNIKAVGGLAAAAKAAASAANVAGGAGGGGAGGGLFDSILSGLGLTEASAASAISGVLGDVLSGGFELESVLADAGGFGGQALGTAIGGPIGGAIGQQLGSALGEALGGAFGQNKDAQANAREGFTDFIREALEGADLQLVIDDALSTLDFAVSGGRDAFSGEGGGLFSTAFDGVSEAGIAAFTGIGNAFDELLGTGENLGSQFGAIFSDQLGGDLNNLQILLQRVGVSAAQMGDAVKEAFLKGNISAIEAFDGLKAVADIAEKGIPQALGAVDKAFENLVKGAGRGHQAVDAIGDIFAEASEKGITSLDQLRQELENSGASAEQLDQLFAAFAETGINSIEQGLNQSLDQTIQVLADLESQNFEFLGGLDDGLNKLEDVVNRIDEIPDEITKRVTFDVEVTGDDIPEAFSDQPSNGI